MRKLTSSGVCFAVAMSFASVAAAQGAPPSAVQSACMQSIDRNAATLAKSQAREVRGCVTLATRGKLGIEPPTLELCITSDSKDKVKRSVTKAVSDEMKRCQGADLPSFGIPPLGGAYTPPADKNSYDPLVHDIYVTEMRDAVVGAQSIFAGDLLGSDRDGAVRIARLDPAGARCQVKLFKAALQCFESKRKLYSKCKLGLLKNGTASNINMVKTACLQSGDNFTGILSDAQRIRSKCNNKIEGTLADECPGVDLGSVYPGPCNTRDGNNADFTDCVVERINCRYCQELNVTNNAGLDCDQFDDSADNDSCNNVLGSCGDGYVDPATEECDDGNTDDGDCCSSACTLDDEGVTCGSDSNNECTEPDTCDGNGICRTNHAAEGTACPDDGNDCTSNVCNDSGECTHPNLENGAACGSQADDECTDPDTCDGGGTCESNDAAQGTTCADDSNVCTDDVCDGSGVCNHSANTASCDDGSFCNGSDTCADGGCSVHGAPPCEGPDGDGDCAETCNEETDSCDGADPDGASCDDGAYCNGADSCSAGVCSSHVGSPCAGADGDDDCRESCNEELNSCNANDPDTSACNDGLFCNGTDSCLAGVCSTHSGDPCPSGPECRQGCNEGFDTCNDIVGTPCSDDGFECTDDFCNGTGTCVHANTTFGEACTDDGNECTTDICNGGGTCVHPALDAGTPCDDEGNVCTTNECDGTGVCQGIPNSVACNDNVFCNGADTCGAGSCSLHAGNPCPGADGDSDCSEVCNESADACSSNDPNGSACDNGLGCDGSDSCQSGTCTPSGVCCGTQTFTFNVGSNSGGTVDPAEWPGGTRNGGSGSCTVNIDVPSGNLDVVGTIGDNFSILGFAGFQSCAGSGGSNGVQCLSCPPAGICNVEAERPSCSAALNGSGSSRYTVQCVDP